MWADTDNSSSLNLSFVLYNHNPREGFSWHCDLFLLFVSSSLHRNVFIGFWRHGTVHCVCAARTRVENTSPWSRCSIGSCTFSEHRKQLVGWNNQDWPNTQVLNNTKHSSRARFPSLPLVIEVKRVVQIRVQCPCSFNSQRQGQGSIPRECMIRKRVEQNSKMKTCLLLNSHWHTLQEVELECILVHRKYTAGQGCNH